LAVYEPAECDKHHVKIIVSNVMLSNVKNPMPTFSTTPRLTVFTRGRSHSYTGQLAGLLYPSDELSFIESVVLVDVEVAHFLVFGLAEGNRM
jgi:hypothetical protein